VTGVPYEGGTDLDYDGKKYVYAGQLGQEGGVHVIDVSGRTPKEVSFIVCPGSQNDVAVVKPGLLALGYHGGQCGIPGAGVRLIDVSNPKRPKILGNVELPGGTHTLMVYPGKPIIYASPGGLANGGGQEQILDVSNPYKIEVASTYRQNPAGCHDVTFSFHEDRKLAFCPGLTETQIWDVSDPLKPVTIGHAVSPSFFPHHAVATPDGTHLIITDEAFGVHDCMGGPTGSVWVFNISVPEAPIFAGHWGPQRGAGISSANGWCTAHNLNFVPGTNMGVISWYTGGTSVLDLSDPLFPEEIAYYQPDDADTWSSYWFDGLIYSNDIARGLEVLEVKGIKEGKS
ncbi:MAG: LVIVD repeat-containing protein, partial [Actinomycetota bacterium]